MLKLSGTKKTTRVFLNQFKVVDVLQADPVLVVSCVEF